MKIYKFDKYKINTGILFSNNYILDERINQKIIIDDHENKKLIKLIFNNYSIKNLLHDSDINTQCLKELLNTLYLLDIICFIRPYSNKCFFEKNIFIMTVKTIVSYMLRFIPFIVCCSNLGMLLNTKLNKIIYIVITFIIMCFVHEFSHIYCYFICNSKNLECYFRINALNIQLITNKTNKKNSRLIACLGPLLASTCGLILFLIIHEPIILGFIFIHLSMLLPFFNDGKIIWS